MDSSKLSSIMAILRESISVPSKNRKLILSVLLLCFFPNFLLLIVGNYTSIYPLLLSLLMKLFLITKEDPNTPQFFDAIVGLKGDAEGFVQSRAILVIASYIVSTISMMIIVHSILMVISGKQSINLFDVYAKVKSTLIHTFLTCIYFNLLYIGYTVISVTLIAVPMLGANGSIASIVIGGVLAMSARLFSVYLAMNWTVGMVVSVAEEGCFGLEALWKGWEIVRGRRLQGFLIALMLLLLNGVLMGGYGFAETRTVAGVILASALVMVKMYSHIVYAVFYCDCRKEASYARAVGNGEEMLP